MKKTPIKVLLAILTVCSGIILRPQIALSQVNTSVLIEVAQSCQRDALSSKYYKNMLFDDYVVKQHLYDGEHYISRCIYDRYYHSLVMSKYPWLASTGEIIPNYPGSVAVSLMIYHNMYSDSNELLIDCIVSQNPSSKECLSSPIAKVFNIGNSKIRDIAYGSRIPKVYICPSCVVAHDDDPSGKSMVKGFIKWFLSLDKSKRREVLSFSKSDGESAEIHKSISEEADKAVEKYQETRERIRQQEINRRREEVLNN
jgi:hypothetical protein